MNLLRELITFDFECNCVRVSFTYEGVDYSFDVPKVGLANGKNRYIKSSVGFCDIVIQWNSTYWAVYISFDSGVYTTYVNTTDNECPFFDSWTFDDGTELENLTTTPCE